MKKIWLYIDRDDKLTFEIYKNEEDNLPEKTFKGRQCYPYIEKYCNGAIKQRKEINSYDSTIYYRNHYIDIFGLENVLQKNGTKPILEDINIYECTQNAKKIKNRKVQRRNKHIKVRIMAAGLAFTILGGVMISNLGNKKSIPDNGDIPISEEIDDFVEEEEKEVEVLDITPDDSNKVVISLDYKDKSNEEKARIAKSYYGKTIEKYAKQYGVDPVIMIAIATQERGIHSEEKDKGGATGLMQIQNNSWKDRELTAFNYNTNKYETIVVNEKDLKDVYYNIKVGCMIFQNNMKEMNNNVIAAIQCYNMGAKNMKKVLNAYSIQTGKSISEILSNVSDCGWLDCRNVVEVGDNVYVENVVRWIGSTADLGTYNNNGEEVDLVVSAKTK